MIKYRLICDDAHEFEGWFRDSADFDVQSSDDLIECPVCGSNNVRKAIMAPAVSTSRSSREARLSEINKDIVKAVARARDYVEKNFEYVGPQFPEEVRKIHYGETEERPIYGEASGKEVKELSEEGIDVVPVPGKADKKEKIGDAKTPAVPEKKLN